MDIISWCNVNNGFVSAVLALLSFFLSVIAILVSVKTSRLPYKKKLKLNTSFEFAIKPDVIGNKVDIIGMSISATNIGFRDLYIRFLGLGIKDEEHRGEFKFIQCFEEEIGGTGILHPAEIHQALYKKIYLTKHLSSLTKTIIYLIAVDSEGKTYSKKLFTGQNILDNLNIY